MLEDVLRDNDLLLKPGSIYNCNKSGFPLQNSPRKVVVPSGLKHVYVSVSGDKTRLTVMACVSASGTAIPPFIVYDRNVVSRSRSARKGKNRNSERWLSSFPVLHPVIVGVTSGRHYRSLVPARFWSL